MPDRVYLWKGGVEPDEIPVIGTDGKIEKNADGTDKMQANPNAGKDWCFAYGEKEWREGKSWSDAKDDTERYVFGVPKANTVNYKTSCGG